MVILSGFMLPYITLMSTFHHLQIWKRTWELQFLTLGLYGLACHKSMLLPITRPILQLYWYLLFYFTIYFIQWLIVWF